MTSNLQFMWLHLVWPVINPDLTFPQTQSLACLFRADSISNASIISWLHDFFPCLPFLSCCLSLLAAGQKWAGSQWERERERGRGGHGPETALKPQPLFEWGFLLGTALSLSLVLQAKERDVEMHSCFISNPPFSFFCVCRHHGLTLRVNTSVTCS